MMYVGESTKNRYYKDGETIPVGFIAGVHENEFEGFISEYDGTTSKGMSIFAGT